MSAEIDDHSVGWVFTKRFVVVVLISIVVPLATVRLVPMDVVEQVFLGLFIFLVGSVVQLLGSVDSMQSKFIEREKIRQIESNGDRLLNNLRAEHRSLASITLYKNFFERELATLLDTASEANSTGELPVDQNSDTTSLMLKDFSGKETDIIRAVHYLGDNKFLFSVHASHFFTDIAALVKSKRVRSVKRLLVIEKDSEIEEDSTKKLIGFHHSTVGFHYRVIRAEDFRLIKRDFGLPGETKDFAVYGTDFVYRSISATDSEISGLFTAGEGKVERFIDAFERCWSSELSYKVDELHGNRVNLADLFARDAVSPNRPKQNNRET